MANSEAMEAIKSLVENGAFKFKADVMYPMQTADATRIANQLLMNTGNLGARVNLDNGYGIIFKNDSAKANLPYIGEVRISRSYLNSSDAGMSFNSRIENPNLENGKQYLLKFSVNDKTENYQIIMRFFNNGTTDVSISSSHRTAVKYRGKIVPLEDDSL
ncbi:DUF4251 domain-containing protein [uncultured Winogradskyella sp.]|uniref:DUF4251 domain-containing protein n=1 Tax=uncultured Winogradskyella sp. TaxID=395353 RepID=UPI0026186B6C|nr:DUF4251 domain-containing protein [uncultured Winogradskyella sp.]